MEGQCKGLNGHMGYHTDVDVEKNDGEKPFHLQLWQTFEQEKMTSNPPQLHGHS